VIGEVRQRWHLWRRKYDLFMDKRQFAAIDGGFLAWEFELKEAGGNTLALIDRYVHQHECFAGWPLLSTYICSCVAPDTPCLHAASWHLSTASTPKIAQLAPMFLDNPCT
jgi:uncharacterized protein YxjI